MTVLKAIYERRSIRKFKEDPVPHELIEKLLEAATKAPSGMNNQPWRFVILEGEKKNGMIDTFLAGLKKFKFFGIKVSGAAHTAEIIRKAPVVILVFNAKSRSNGLIKFFSSVMDILNIESIGGAIQTMLLAAQELGLGTLWVGHIFYTRRKICKYIRRYDELIAAVAVGFPDEEPTARPRKSIAEVVEWL